MHSPLSQSPPDQRRRASASAQFTLVDLRLPAHSSELKRARDCVAAAAAEFGLSPKARYELVFAVNEAVTNAVKHGRPYQDGAIGLRIEGDGEALVCTVTDAGPFIAPTCEPDLARGESGRGLPLMSAMTDEFDLIVEPAATIVRLRKLRPASADDA